MRLIGARRTIFLLSLSCLGFGSLAPGGDECDRGTRRVLYREGVVAGAQGTATTSASFDTKLAGAGVRYVVLVRCPRSHHHALVRGHRCPAAATHATVTLNGALVFETGAVCTRDSIVVPLRPVTGPANTIVTTVTGPPGARIDVTVLALRSGGHGDACNTPPTADAGADQTLRLGATAVLDGSGSTDADGDALTFAWSILSLPTGSRAALSDPAAIDPSFTIDVPGTYVTELVVHDGQAASAPDTVSITTGNSPPVADAGPDRSAFLGISATLDGSGSRDPDGDPLTFTWTLGSRPAGSVAAVGDPAAVHPTLVPDVPGTYELQLVVNDGLSDSAPDTVLVTTQNTPPVADAGDDQSVVTGVQVTLDGSGSTDVDGDSLTYAWALTSIPAGSLASLDEPGAVRPRFVADRPGTYVAQLVVDDGLAASAPDTVRVSTQNSPPVADAGPDQTVVAGQLVSLDGTASSDADGDALAFEWSLTSRPAGSTAALSDPMSPTPMFTADRPGTYVVQLVVNDGVLSSAPDTATISTTNSAPVADAGPDQAEAPLGAVVVLDGSASFDVDGQPLTYAWSLLFRPAGSAATLNGDTTVAPEFAPDVVGDYVAQLIVNDGLVGSAPDTVTVSTENPAPVVTVTATDPLATETGLDPGVFTVSRTGPTTAALTVIYTVSGVATSGIDYVSLGSSVTLPSGAASAPVTVTPIDDTLIEGAENVVLTLQPSAAYVLGTPLLASVAIADDDLSVVSIEATDPDAAEAGLDSGTFTLRRTGDAAQPLSVALALAGNANGTDFAGFSLSPVIPAGQDSITIRVIPRADNLVEGPETVVLTISPTLDFVISGPVSATVVIADDPPVVSVIATDPDAAEAGPDPGAFTFTRAGGDLATALLVGFTRGGSASVSDYASIGSSLTLPANQTAAALTITPVGDALVEGAETVVLTVAASSNVTVGTPASATVTIADNPAPVVTVAATDAMASEAGDTGTFTITRTGSFAFPLVVSYALAGTATNGVDYAYLPTTVTIPSGADSAALTVVPIDDGDLESAEGVQIQLLADAGYLVGTPSAAVVTIADDDTLVSVVASDPVAAENGSDPGAFRVSRQGPSADPLTVFYTLSGAAEAGVDYVPLPGSVTLPAGATEATVPIEPLDDALIEGPESVVLALKPGPGYKVGALGAATVTIQDDERPAVSIVVSDGTAGEAGPEAGAFSITRTGPTTGALTVFYDIAGLASQGVDYQALSGSVTIPPGAASAAVVITPIDDSLIEGAESVVLTLRADPGYVVVTPGIAILSIADDDLGVVTIAATDPDASEAGTSSGTFVLSRTGDTSAALLVILTRGGTATNASDYASLGGPTFTMTIPAGEFSAPLTISPLADNLVEGDETVVLTVATSLTYVVGNPSTATVTIADDAPVVSIVAADADAAESGLDPGAFVITRRGGNTAAALTVFVAVGGTATANRDYAVLSGNASIPAGQAAVPIAVTTLRDNLVEAPETVEMTLLSANGTTYLVGSPSSATVTIADDPPVVAVVVTDPDAAEGGLEPGSVSFTRTGGDLDAPLNVFFNKSGTATNGADYASLGGALSLVVISAGQPSASVAIVPLADNLVEGPEVAILTLGSSSGYVIGAASSGTVTIADDPPVVTVVATDPDAAETGPDSGTFRFMRSGGNLATALTIGFTRGGTAANGFDYVTIPLEITLAAGQSSGTVTITPVDDALVEGPETVVLTVKASNTVVVGSPATATVTIADND